MAMTLTDFRQLSKLMGLTISENDAEALSAIRKANAILKRYNYTWADAFAKLVKVDSGVPDVEDGSHTIPNDDYEPRRATRPSQVSGGDPELDEQFEIVMAYKKFSSRFKDLLDDFYSQYQERGSLSPRQREILRDAADEAR